MISFNDMLTNDIISFEQLGPGDQYLHVDTCKYAVWQLQNEVSMLGKNFSRWHFEIFYDFSQKIDFDTQIGA